MKVLLFKLIKDKEIIINKELPYYINDNKINISDDEELYKININDNIFMKKNKESLIKIDFKKKLMHIDLLENDLHLDIPLLKSKFLSNKNLLELTYMLDDGENVVNKVELYY